MVIISIGTTTVDSGTDTVDYSYITDGKAINADLGRTNSQEVFQVGTSGNFDHLVNIENIIGSKMLILSKVMIICNYKYFRWLQRK